jgi:hypothetical protein
MTLHVSLCDMQVNMDFTSSFNSCDLTTNSLGDDISILLLHSDSYTRLKDTEELFAAIVMDRLEHADGLLIGSRANRHMSATISKGNIIAVGIFSGAV